MTELPPPLLEPFWLACQLPAIAWPAARARFQLYRQLIATHADAAGLTGPSALDDFYVKHVADSLAVLQVWPELLGLGVGPSPRPRRLADLGAGAGLPGLVLAIALEHLTVTAIESNQRKARFIALAAEQLRLAPRVRVVARRGREVGRLAEYAGQFDLVVSRAVATADKLVAECRHLLAPGGSAIFYKTPETIAAEMPLAAREAGKHRLELQASGVIELPAGAGRRQFFRLVAKPCPAQGVVS